MAPNSGLLPIAPFTWDAIVSGRQKDPINLVYAGQLADVNAVYELTKSVLRCDKNHGVGDQYFGEPLSPVVRHRQDFNQADAYVSGILGRVHTRIYSVFSEDPRFGRFVASPIHIDKTAWCGGLNDAADSFDLAREWAIERLRQHDFEVAYFPNGPADGIVQCDGRVTASDGRFALVADRPFFAARGIPTG